MYSHKQDGVASILTSSVCKIHIFHYPQLYIAAMLYAIQIQKGLVRRVELTRVESVTNRATLFSCHAIFVTQRKTMSIIFFKKFSFPTLETTNYQGSWKPGTYYCLIPYAYIRRITCTEITYFLLIISKSFVFSSSEKLLNPYQGIFFVNKNPKLKSCWSQQYNLLNFSKHRPSGPMLSISRSICPCVCFSVCLF